MLSLSNLLWCALCVSLLCTARYHILYARNVRESGDRKSKDRDWDSTLHKHSQVRLCSSTHKAKFMWSINWNFNVFPHFSFGTVVFHVYAYAFNTHLNGVKQFHFGIHSNYLKCIATSINWTWLDISLIYWCNGRRLTKFCHTKKVIEKDWQSRANKRQECRSRISEKQKREKTDPSSKSILTQTDCSKRSHEQIRPID